MIVMSTIRIHQHAISYHIKVLNKTILELVNFLSNRLQYANAAGVGVDDHVYLEAIIFRAEQGLLVLSPEGIVRIILGILIAFNYSITITVSTANIINVMISSSGVFDAIHDDIRAHHPPPPDNYLIPSHVFEGVALL